MTNLHKKYIYPCLETIKIENGTIHNLSFHNARLNKTQKQLFQTNKNIQLEEHIKIPNKYKTGLVKCRITYTQKINKIEFEHYNQPIIKSLQIIKCNYIDYQYKSANRQQLKNLFEKRGSCDDIIIVKGNYITDSYFANIILFDGTNWHTPTTPLLKGTQRAKLLEDNKIELKEIKIEDLKNYQYIGLINALLDMQNMPVVSTKNIRF